MFLQQSYISRMGVLCTDCIPGGCLTLVPNVFDSILMFQSIRSWVSRGHLLDVLSCSFSQPPLCTAQEGEFNITVLPFLLYYLPFIFSCNIY